MEKIQKNFISGVVLLVSLLVTACGLKDGFKNSEKCYLNSIEVNCDDLSPVSDKPVSSKSMFEQCLDVAQSFLLADQVAIVCQNPNKYTTDCLQAANLCLFREDAITVCKSARSDSTQCILDGNKNGLPSDAIATLCK